MSKTTVALEAAVSTVIENTPPEGVRQTARQRANADKAFAMILKLIAPRIRHFIRQYGLMAHWDDAEQCCAIGVHRAIQGYDPTKAQFTTFVNWQLRGELQSLRFRLMTDQRPSAKKVDATTVSLHAFAVSADGEETTLEAVIEDEDALSATESAASDYLAETTRSALIDRYVEHLRAVGEEQILRRLRNAGSPRPTFDPGVPRLRALARTIDPAALAALEEEIAQHRALIERRMFEEATLDEVGLDTGITKERARQITKRAARTMAELAAGDTRFGRPIDDGRGASPLTRRRRSTETPVAALLPDPGAPQGQEIELVAIAPLGDDQHAANAPDGEFDQFYGIVNPAVESRATH